MRTESNRIFDIVSDTRLDRKIKAGRPKLRWLDLKRIGIKGWTKKAQDRLEWFDVTRKAEVKLRGP
jgi:hypothetical protein